ncbi:E3 ubiquitin-protein ligase TRIM33 isoform X3 [Thalassophryne amazonica]|uniref:E3 ubiquitin-protein ligase TRIM33 isoform X3 n=1 Tax=Thalassophryne amazonica TaxID=390379 RepID=UPI0014710B25|nr:E3 ubiquitin-protein ligase TRIM33 isoform X3 [Thalassophryne amazonica]
MADNKGEEDMEAAANSDSVPSAQENQHSETKDEAAVIVIEANTKDSEEAESSDNANEAPIPTSDRGDVSNGGAAGGEASNAAVSPAAASSSNAAVSPAAASSSNAAVSPATTNSSSAETAAEVPSVGEPSIGGLNSEMSPPPTVPAATPVPAPINLLDTCAVCKQSLQSRDCEPKLLPCLHSFCLKCLPQPDRQISLQVSGAHGQTDTHIVNVMRCSVCHQDFKQTDIIDNYFVKDTTEATNTSDEKAAQVCTSCEDNAGTIGFCVECGEWLCKTCVEAHQRVKITKDHKIRTKEDADAASESVSMSGQRPVFCPIHKQEPLKLFCETCDTLTCRDCQLLEHKEHRYQFLEEAFQNQKGVIETTIAKLQEKKSYVHYSLSQVQSRLKELNETHRKVEHEIKIAVFTLINEINKKGKSLLQQLESVTKERSMRLVAQHKDTTQLAQQIHHVLNFCHWAITTGSSTALLYSKRLILFQLRQLFKARLEPAPQANGVVRFFCDPTFWAKNVVNLGNLVIEKPPPPPPPPNVMVGGPPISPGQGLTGKHPGQINLAQLRLQHMQQAAYAQQKQQQQQQQQHQQQIQQQMRIASQMTQTHPRQAGPPMVQQQPPRLISMQQLPRAHGGMNGGPGPPMYPSSHHMRLPGPPQNRMATAQPRHNGQQYPSMMQPQLQRQMSIESEMSHQRFRFLLQSGQHSNPGHAGPFPVASLHNANPTSPTSASMAGAHAHRGPTSPVIGPIELIPSVTNPENLPCLPEIPPIQLEDAGSSSLGHLLSRYISASTQHQLGPMDMNPSPGLSTHSPGSSGVSNAHTPARPSSTSSTGSRGSCSSAGRAGHGGGASADHVRVKQEPGADDNYSCPASSLKTEQGKDAGRSACMMGSPENSPHPVLGIVSRGQDALKSLGERIKTEPQSETPCSGLNGSRSATMSSSSSTSFPGTCSTTGAPLTNGNMDKRVGSSEGGTLAGNANPGEKEDDPNEDWCAVCINGGDLLCCDRCPKVFHMKCHVPTIKIFPKGDFLCTFCRSLTSPEIVYCEEIRSAKGERGLSPEDQRRCERLLLYIFCHELSVGFREPVPSSVPDYYKIIKHPMDLKKVKKKLQVRSSQFYQTTQEFVSDMRLIFKNCAEYNEMSRIIQVYDEDKQINTQVGSEMAVSGKAVSLYFEEKLQEIFPGQSFQETTEPESLETQERDRDEATDDSDEDFIQPRRKRLKMDEKVVHIK